MDKGNKDNRAFLETMSEAVEQGRSRYQEDPVDPELVSHNKEVRDRNKLRSRARELVTSPIWEEVAFRVIQEHIEEYTEQLFSDGGDVNEEPLVVLKCKAKLNALYRFQNTIVGLAHETIEEEANDRESLQ